MVDGVDFKPSPIQKRIAWAALTGFCVVLLGSIAVGAIFGVSWILGYLQPVLVPIAVAAILAYLLEPVILFLIKKKVQRKKAVMITFGSFMLLLVFLAFMVIYPAVKQGRAFWSEYLTEDEKIVAQLESKMGQSKSGGNPAEISWISKTKLGESGGQILTYVDDRIGHFGFFKQFNHEEVGEDGQPITKWHVDELANWLWARLSGFLGEVAIFFGRGFSSAASMLGYLFGLILVPIYLFFFLRESTSIAQSWSDYVPLRRSKLKDEVVEVLAEINEYLVAYFRGQMLVSMIDAALVTTALLFLGLPYALLLGVFLAILGLIPYVGSLLVMIPTVIITLVHFGRKITISAAERGNYDASRIVEVMRDTPDGPVLDRIDVFTNTWDTLPTQVWAYVVIVVGLFVILQQINGFVTAPKIVGESVGLHPLTVIFSMFFWSLFLGGLLGALLAVPLTASVKVLFRRYIWERRFNTPEEAMLESKEKGADAGAS